MKKIFTLALVLMAMGAVCDAQNYVMTVHQKDTSTREFDTENIESVTIDESEWVSLGMCEYTEDFLASFFSVVGYSNLVVTYDVEIQENSEQPGLYRLVNPYGTDYPYNGVFGMPFDPGNHYMEINATDPEGVYIDMQDSGFWSPAYGEMYVYSQAAYYMDEQGYTLQDAKNWALTGSLRDGVITFPTQMTLIYFPYYTDILYYANLNDAFKVVLPEARKDAKKEKAVAESEVTVIGQQSGLRMKK